MESINHLFSTKEKNWQMITNKTCLDNSEEKDSNQKNVLTTIGTKSQGGFSRFCESKTEKISVGQ